MENQAVDLIDALRRGPAFLFLGQNYLRLESGKDMFLSEVLRKYGGLPDTSTYSGIFKGEAGVQPDTALPWMHNLCKRISVPQWLETVSQYHWNGVLSTAIDAVWASSFQTEWRELQSLFDDSLRPLDPRNRHRLHCTHLFGSVAHDGDRERPPLTAFELLRRRNIALALVRRLPELVTPRGVLVIEGYAGGEDWLPPEDLMPILYDLNEGQIHLFNPTPDIWDNPNVMQLISAKKIQIYEEGLAQFISRAAHSGRLSLDAPIEDHVGRQIQLESKYIGIPTDIWNQTSQSAIILDDAMVEAAPLSSSANYAAFKRFLEESSVRPVWSGYSRRYNFERDFEKKLFDIVSTRLNSRELLDDPIILHGQTGTGKTVALGALAYKIRRTKKYPVLFIERKSQRPNYLDLDTFCKLCEDAGSPATLVVWDGMGEPDQYSELLRRLSSRGRKVVLVGSSYRLDADSSPSKKRRGRSSIELVEAPATLQDEEFTRFREFLTTIHPSLVKYVMGYGYEKDFSYLVALYRLLPETRRLLREGLVREVGVAEQTILERARHIHSLVPEESTFAGILRAALEKTRPELLTRTSLEVDGEAFSEADVLVGLVMVPGRFGLKVPLELLLRAMGTRGFQSFIQIYKHLDIFRWDEDLQGNITICPRHPLEADQLVKVKFGGPAGEMDLVKRLLLHLKDNDIEIPFAVDLVRSVGAGGPYSTYFASQYRELARTLQTVRLMHGVENVRLMLQEANALREWAQNRDKVASKDSDILEATAEAESVLRRGLEIMEDTQPRGDALRSNFYVELAATLGAKMNHLHKNGRRERRELHGVFLEIKKLVRESRAMDPSGYHAVDVLAWTTRDLLEFDVLDVTSKAELIADLRYAFDTVHPEDLSASQLVKLQSRRYNLGRMLDDAELTATAFEALREQGSGAGYYLHASQLAALPEDFEILPADAQLRCREAAEYLDVNREQIKSDERCLHLLLQLWWLGKIGKRMFYGERQTVPFNHSDWSFCHNLLLSLAECRPLSEKPRLKYLLGLVCFQLNRIQDSLDVYAELKRDASGFLGGRRVIRSYLLSDSAGKPRQFTGIVRWAHPDGYKGEIYVEELRRLIEFSPNEFGKPDVEPGAQLNKFHLAFNFFGPAADPAHRARR